MSWGYTRWNDGDALSQVNTDLEAGETFLNAIDEDALRRGALNRHHAMRIMPLSAAEYHDNLSTVTPPDHTYGIPTFGAQMIYTAYDNDGTTDRVVIGDALSGASKRMELLFSQRVGQGNSASPDDDCAAILVLANVHLKEVTTGAIDVQSPNVMFALQYRENVSTWRTIASSVRMISLDEKYYRTADATWVINADIPLAALVTPTLFADHATPASDAVGGVRAVMSVYTNPLATGFDASTEVVLAGWNISALALFSEDAA